MVKLALIVGVFIPVISPLSLLLLILLAASYSWRVFFTWDWRILLIIPVNIGLFVTFFYAAAVGIVTGRQKIYYK
jgi:hypothetical protein